VRFIMSQSAGSGLANVASVTGTNACARAPATDTVTHVDAIIRAIVMWDEHFMFSSQ
jgi:hypothetical protein